jgi:hypothetical protein
MPALCKADPHASVDAVNDPALMAIHCLGAGHPGAIPPGRRRVLVSLCRHRQIHQVAGSNPCGQDQQVIYNQVHQVHRLQVWGSELDHH